MNYSPLKRNNKDTSLPNKYYLLFGPTGALIGWTAQKQVAQDVKYARLDMTIEKMYYEELHMEDLSIVQNENMEFQDFYPSFEVPIYMTFDEYQIIEEGIVYFKRGFYDSWKEMIKVIYSQEFLPEEREYLHVLFSQINTTFHMDFKAEEDDQFDVHATDFNFEDYINPVGMMHRSHEGVLRPELIEKYVRPIVEVSNDV